MSFLLRASATVLDEQLVLVVVWYVVSLDQLWVVNEELLDATSQQVDVVEAFLGEHLGRCSAMALVVGEHNYNFVFQILKPTQGLEVVVPVDPAVRETHGAEDMKLAIFFVAVHSVAPHVEQDHVLRCEVEELLQALVGAAYIRLLGASDRLAAFECLIIIDIE